LEGAGKKKEKRERGRRKKVLPLPPPRSFLFGKTEKISRKMGRVKQNRCNEKECRRVVVGTAVEVLFSFLVLFRSFFS
jgi:hypothetical protein